jgi:hypothetical protein
MDDVIFLDEAGAMLGGYSRRTVQRMAAAGRETQ